jgi:hypothetical protein
VPKTLSATGPAVLRFPNGHSVSVDGQLTMSRSFFSVSGEGEFTTDSNTASEAFLSGEPLSLTFIGTTPTEIVVHKARTAPESARCWFRVHA